MGRYGLRITDILRNPWLCKLKHKGSSKTTTLSSSPPSPPPPPAPTPPPPPPEAILINHGRPSSNDKHRLSPLHPKACDTKFLVVDRTRSATRKARKSTKPALPSKPISPSLPSTSPLLPGIDADPSMLVVDRPPIQTKPKMIMEEERPRSSTKRSSSGFKVSSAASHPPRIQHKPSGRGLVESFAVAKKSVDPQSDFRESMVEMIVENGITTAAEMEELLSCYLSLNSREYHELILEVFQEIWFELKSLKLQ